MYEHQLEPLPVLTRTKRLRWACRVNEESWSWLRRLMETDPTRAVFDEDPYVEVFRFRENIYGLFSENCDGMSDIWQYLIVGPSRALLIDTGFGLGNLPGLCDKLSGGKELIVVNTHDHFDHAYGNCLFERVYCHEHCVPYLENQHEHMWDYLFDAVGQGMWLDFDRSALPQFKKYEIIGLPDGHVFDLGDGYEVELIFTGGHAAGHSMFLDRSSRLLFAGDGVCSNRTLVGWVGMHKSGKYGEDTLLAAYRDRLAAVAARADEYDSVFPSHYINGLPSDVTGRLLRAVDDVLRDPLTYDRRIDTWGSNRDTPNTAYQKDIENCGVLEYKYRG